MEVDVPRAGGRHGGVARFVELPYAARQLGIHVSPRLELGAGERRRQLWKRRFKRSVGLALAQHGSRRARGGLRGCADRNRLRELVPGVVSPSNFVAGVLRILVRYWEHCRQGSMGVNVLSAVAVSAH